MVHSTELTFSTRATPKMFQTFHVLTLVSLKSNELEIITIFTARAHTYAHNRNTLIKIFVYFAICFCLRFFSSSLVRSLSHTFYFPLARVVFIFSSLSDCSLATTLVYTFYSKGVALRFDCNSPKRGNSNKTTRQKKNNKLKNCQQEFWEVKKNKNRIQNCNKSDIFDAL